MRKFFRSKKTGVILGYNKHLVDNPDAELVTELEAFPERFAPPQLFKRPSLVTLDVPKEVAEPPPYTPPEAQADLGRDFNRPNSKPVTVDQNADISSLISGMEGEL